MTILHGFFCYFCQSIKTKPLKPLLQNFMQMKLSFKEAARGVDKEINVSIMDSCPSCRGKGSEPGTTTEK